MTVVSGIKVDLSPDEIRKARSMLGREPNEVEIGMIDVMWSEHCSYKSSRPVLKLLPTKGPRVIVGPGQDAGIVDIGDGLAVVFKIESHNHPSAIDPYNGAATGIGGIIRDVLCMGAVPIALIDPLRFGELGDSHTNWLLTYVVRGIADYGNCCGIPTVGGELEFDESFAKNCLVNVGCIGIVKRDRIIPSEMRDVGDYLVIMGGLTGRDGIHGVTFASKTLTEESEADRPAVQIGDPFAKKLVIDATLEATQTGYVRGLKDLGGGGLTCATSEMSNRGGTGADVSLEKIPVREEGMDPFELMLSESQERMLLVVKPQGLEEVTKVFEKYGLPFAVIGRVTDTGEVVARERGRTVARIPSRILADPPMLRRKAIPPSYISGLLSIPKPRMPKDLRQVLCRLIASPNIASKEWVYRQYDHEVGVRTIVKPGDADAAVLRVLQAPNKAIAVKADCNSRHCLLDPYNGGAGAVAEGASNVAAVGASPIAMVDCCNFGSPERPEIFWQFVQSVRGMADMCSALGIPSVGGNVSFYNEDEITGAAVNPSPVVLMLGLIDNLDWITTLAFKEVGSSIVVIGETRDEMGGSEYYHVIHNLRGGSPPEVDPESVKRAINCVLASIHGGYVRSAHDCSRGGLATALAIMAIKGDLGVDVDIGNVPTRSRIRTDEVLFSESYGRFVLECSAHHVGKVLMTCQRNRVPASVIGRTLDRRELLLRNAEEVLVRLPLVEMGRLWRDSIPKRLGVKRA